MPVTAILDTVFTALKIVSQLVNFFLFPEENVDAADLIMDIVFELGDLFVPALILWFLKKVHGREEKNKD